MRSRRKKTVENESQQPRPLADFLRRSGHAPARFVYRYVCGERPRTGERRSPKVSAAQNTGGDGILPEHNALKNDRARFEQNLLENPVLNQKTKMRQTERGLIISLSEAGFFAPGEAVINAEAENVINTLAESLKANRVQIRVEGHTDSTPISNARYPQTGNFRPRAPLPF